MTSSTEAPSRPAAASCGLVSATAEVTPQAGISPTKPNEQATAANPPSPRAALQQPHAHCVLVLMQALGGSLSLKIK